MASIVYLGLSIIVFIIVYGTIFTLVPVIFGAVFSIGDDWQWNGSSWQAIYNQNQDTARLLVPLIPSFGIVLIVVKVLMAATTQGRD